MLMMPATHTLVLSNVFLIEVVFVIIFVVAIMVVVVVIVIMMVELVMVVVLLLVMLLLLLLVVDDTLRDVNVNKNDLVSIVVKTLTAMMRIVGAVRNEPTTM